MWPRWGQVRREHECPFVSSVENLKERARSFEQNEQWGEALDLYSQAIDLLSNDDTPDIALFNRSGDLATRIGSAAQAVAFYERAVDFYMDAGLPNNAVAVCKKVMRNLPDRYSIHLKLGQIRAAQGFITDARSSFVTYAENVQAAGDLDEALRALIEFVNLAPDDYEICMILAAQLEQNGRGEEALTQYIGAFRIMRRQGLSELAQNVAVRIRSLDPDLDLEKAASDEVFNRQRASSAPVQVSEDEESASGPEEEIIGPVDLPLMSFDDDDDGDAKAAEEAAARAAEETAAKAAQEAADKAEEAAAARVAEEAAARAAEGAAAQAQKEAIAKAAEEAASIAAAAKAAEEAEATAAAAKAAEHAEAKAAQEAAAKAAQEAAAREAAARAAEEAAAKAKEEAEATAAEEAAAKAREEAAARAEEEAAEEAAAKAVEEAEAKAAAAKAAVDAAATAGADSRPEGRTSGSGEESYVDIASMLLGETGKNAPKSTRFVVPYEEPTGDDQADFKRMLGQFKQKVAENIDSDDVTAHYDLGTAYMEMGLLDEAIGEFQLVLRGTTSHLATYEMLGQTFLQKQEPEAALKSLTRGLEAPCEVEEERVGIYYYLGLAHETIGDNDTALGFYDRVFAIDINFADVTERLRSLRG